ncbi:histidine phosphatase family protein [Angustibacter speluncae]
MPTLLLVRHGRTGANTAGVLAGRAPGTTLDDHGRGQAVALAERLDPLPLVRVVASPLERTVATAAALVGRGGTRAVPRPEVVIDEGLTECDYGDWTGRALKDLAKEPVWSTVQQRPSAAVFPGGEGLADVQHRAVAAVRRHDAEVEAEHGPHAIWVAVSHGDVIKAVLADALGLHLDGFQRIVVDPCSVSVVRYAPLRPFVLATNGDGSGLGSLVVPPKRRRRKPSSDAAVGGGAGTGD